MASQAKHDHVLCASSRLLTPLKKKKKKKKTKENNNMHPKASEKLRDCIKTLVGQVILE